MVRFQIVEPTCKACGAQTDIREFLVGKKVKAVETVDVEPSTVASQTQPENSKTRRHKVSVVYFNALRSTLSPYVHILVLNEEQPRRQVRETEQGSDTGGCWSEFFAPTS